MIGLLAALGIAITLISGTISILYVFQKLYLNS